MRTISDLKPVFFNAISCSFVAYAEIVSKREDADDEAEKRALRVYNILKAECSGTDELSFVICEHGFKIEYLVRTDSDKYSAKSDSVTLYVMCETIEKLQNLRELFDSKRLQAILLETFTRASELDELIELDVDWSYGSYLECVDHLLSSRMVSSPREVRSDKSLKRGGEDTEPVQLTKRPTPPTEVGESSREDRNGW